MTSSDDVLVSRYRENYGLPAEAPLTAEQVREHLRLETELTARLLSSTSEDRWMTFRDCYDKLYGALPWLADTGGSPDAERWAELLGPSPQKIYEVGSGDGGLARALASFGYQVEATDISNHRGGTRRESERLKWSVTDGVHLERFATDVPYDAVISDQLIEHLHPDDLATHLGGCHSILRPGGKFVLRTPHAFAGPHDVSRVFGYVEPIGMHLREYTNRALKDQLLSAGFRDICSVLWLPRQMGGAPNGAAASRLHLIYLTLAEQLLGVWPPRARRALAMRLPGPLQPRIFLVAHRPSS